LIADFALYWLLLVLVLLGVLVITVPVLALLLWMERRFP
jgi:hypothetical protein